MVGETNHHAVGAPMAHVPDPGHNQAAVGHDGEPDSGHGHGHGHGVSGDADRRWLGIALGLIVSFMVTEVVVGLIAGSLALISDAGHGP